MKKKNNTNWSDLSGATFLTKDDVAEPQVVTIQKFTREEVGQDADARVKTIVHWKEDMRPLVAGPTVINQIRAVTGAERPKEAIGKKIELYLDPTIVFKGKVTGGVRVRMPSA